VKTPLAIRVVVLVAGLAALLALAGPAAAAKPCGLVVIDDWSDGRIDKQYPLHCYDDAIEALPRDVRDYSSAEEDMRRALQAAMRGEAAPPNRDTDTAPEPADPEDPDTPTSTEPPTDTGGTPPAGPPGGDDGDPEAAPIAETESASSVPIPLLILAGLALLLVAGGTAGYLIRRYQARRVPRPTT
jgi:hypothetical protein